MNNVLFIYGPPGCGKTTNKDRFLNHYKNYGYTAIYEEAHYFDDTTKQLNNAIVLCTEKPGLAVVEMLRGKIRSFKEAMDDSQQPVSEA